MTPIGNLGDSTSKTEEGERIAVSLLNDFLYCHRRAALKVVDGRREANRHTVRGDIVHEHADLAGFEVRQGILLWRALPVWSVRLGLNGKCDIVEVEGGTGLKSGICNLQPGNITALRPVEFKLGKRRQWENDDAQLCAQALCLEEMFGLDVPRGAIFHADSKRRREVEFTPELRRQTEQAVAELHRLLGQFTSASPASESPRLPVAIYKPACEECSLYEMCLPELADTGGRLARLTRQLFEI